VYWKIDDSYNAEDVKKLWWSLYELKTFLACTLGRPVTIDEYRCTVPTPSALASQSSYHGHPLQDYEPMPPEYCAAAATFGKIFGRVNRHVSFEYADSRTSLAAADELLAFLHKWWYDLPSTLRLGGGDDHNPRYCRAISYLALRYHDALMVLTRPALFYRQTDPLLVEDNADPKLEICERSNDESMVILKIMYERNLIRNTNWFDTVHIIANALVLFHRGVRNPSIQFLSRIQDYIPVISLTGHTGKGKYAIGALTSLMHDLEEKCLPREPTFSPSRQPTENLTPNVHGHMFATTAANNAIISPQHFPVTMQQGYFKGVPDEFWNFGHDLSFHPT